MPTRAPAPTPTRAAGGADPGPVKTPAPGTPAAAGGRPVASSELPLTAPVPVARTRPSALAGELRVAIGRSARRIRAERGEADLSEPQFAVLAALTAMGPMTPTALAEREHVRPPSMTRTVNSLVELGLVAKTGHPTDGRQVTVTLTAAGEEEVRETRRRRDAWLTRRLATLTAEERAVLVRAVELLRRVASP
jgi:DNA-binding MarR family transcriptional regulator